MAKHRDDSTTHNRALELVLTSMCVAVETQASRDQDGPVVLTSPEDALVRIYRENMWKQPLERALRVANDWSLAKFQTTKALFWREITYPADAKVTPAVDAQQPEEMKDGGSSDSTQMQQLQQSAKTPKKRQRMRAPTAKSDDAPELFRTAARIDEDPLEARWDHQGNSVPLRRNILGEHYAPYSDPLRFIKQHQERSPVEIYQQMKLAVRVNLKDRERRRIQTLNDREKLRRQQLEAQGVLSPEAALEAKFDCMFVNEAGPNNEPQQSNNNSECASLGKGEKARSAGDDVDEQDDDEADDNTDEASGHDEANNDTDDNQQQRRVRVR